MPRPIPMETEPVTMLLIGFPGDSALVDAERCVSRILAGFPGSSLLIYDKLDREDPGLEEYLQRRGIEKLPHLAVLKDDETLFSHSGDFDETELSMLLSRHQPDERGQEPLCPECTAAYRELRHSADSSYCLSFEPVATLVWGDEHPDGKLPAVSHRQECRQWVTNLQLARNHVWESGDVADGHREFWEQARILLPEWPGFSRLNLDGKQSGSYRACAGEKDEVFDMVVKQYNADIHYACTGAGFVVKGFTCRPGARRGSGDGDTRK